MFTNTALYAASDRERFHDESSISHLRFPSYINTFRSDLVRVMQAAFFRRLQGKTQLLPAGESDYFRNRLTHSLEVAEVSELVTLKVNSTGELPGEVDQEVVRLAAICHDTGHPPFAHKGERALARIMATHGGFEGNAQTVHLLAKTAKLLKGAKAGPYGVSRPRTTVEDGPGEPRDKRCGLNLTARSLAAVLKYDKCIPVNPGEKPCKGYYEEESDLVRWVKDRVTGGIPLSDDFRTIECSIMDVSDDIAYSVFDLEDALHAGFLRVTDLFSGGEVSFKVAKAVTAELHKKKRIPLTETFNGDQVVEVLWGLLKESLKRLHVTSEFNVNLLDAHTQGAGSLRNFLRSSQQLASNGYQRTALSLELLFRFIDSIQVEVNPTIPALSRVTLSHDAAVEVECLKQFVATTLTYHSRVQVAEWRAEHVITQIFQAISTGGQSLLPDDYASILGACDNDERIRSRVICDFVAGMTERYALEFYGRLYSDRPETLFKPL